MLAMTDNGWQENSTVSDAEKEKRDGGTDTQTDKSKKEPLNSKRPIEVSKSVVDLDEEFDEKTGLSIADLASIGGDLTKEYGKSGHERSLDQTSSSVVSDLVNGELSRSSKWDIGKRASSSVEPRKTNPEKVGPVDSIADEHERAFRRKNSLGSDSTDVILGEAEEELNRSFGKGSRSAMVVEGTIVLKSCKFVYSSTKM